MPKSLNHEQWRMKTLKMASIMVTVLIPTSFSHHSALVFLESLRKYRGHLAMKKGDFTYHMVFIIQWDQTLTQIKSDSKANFHEDFECMLPLQPKTCNWYFQPEVCRSRHTGINSGILSVQQTFVGCHERPSCQVKYGLIPLDIGGFSWATC